MNYLTNRTAVVLVIVVLISTLLTAVLLKIAVDAIGRSTPSEPALIAAEGLRTMEFSQGVIRYTDDGTGPAVLFLHGFNGQLGQWNDVWAAMPACGRRIRIDVPGYGGSRWNTRDYTLEAQGSRIIEFLDRLGIKKIRLLGGSMGGSLALHLAATYPERFEQVTVFAPSGYSGSLQYHGVYGAIVKPGILNYLAAALVNTKFYQDHYPLSRAAQAVSVTSSYGQRWEAKLPHIRSPALIAWSRGDKGVAPEAANHIHSEVKGSILLWLDETTGHELQITRPQLLAEMACQMLDGKSPAEMAHDLKSLHPGEGVL